ncbi:unnamed protein product, partial [Candidula unifasciata]
VLLTSYNERYDPSPIVILSSLHDLSGISESPTAGAPESHTAVSTPLIILCLSVRPLSHPFSLRSRRHTLFLCLDTYAYFI